jgi:hypothetical protein
MAFFIDRLTVSIGFYLPLMFGFETFLNGNAPT